MKNNKVYLLALATFLSLSACSRPSAQAPANGVKNSNSVAATTMPDACGLLTKEIAESVLGPLTDPPKTDGSNAYTSNCMYLAPDFSAVTLMVTGGGTFEQSFQASKGISGVDAIRMDGIGEGAFWAGGALNQLNVLKNGKWMIFMAPGAGDDQQKVLTEVAQKVLANQ